MKRILLMVLRLFYKAPGWFYKICKYGKDEKFEKYSDEERYRVLQELTTRANRAGRVKVACYGHTRDCLTVSYFFRRWTALFRLL